MEKKRQKSSATKATTSLVLITGGCRSGKSRHAQRLAESIDGRRVYIATASAMDKEMDERIIRHRAEREVAGWETIEEPLDLSGALTDSGGSDVVVVDCLTLWINNLMYEASETGRSLNEDEIAEKCREFLDVSKRADAMVVFVSNEVGLGIVPDNDSARQFRDLAGRCNQIVAAGVDDVIMMVSGLPLHLKNRKN